MMQPDHSENAFGKDDLPLSQILSALDSLPTAARRRLDYARINLYAGPYLDEWRGGASVRELTTMIDEDESRLVAQFARETYGPDHPDARMGRVSVARRW